MKLLTFLGVADYKETTYVLRGQRHTTRYCPAAIAQFCRPEKTLVVVTDLARQKNYDPLAGQISQFNPTAVNIPDGRSEADLWTIFDALTGAVQAGDELVVDITNGFRSLPFLSFLAIAFLRLARRVEVEAVYYGAWEARNRETNESPVFDLTPFVTLLSWTIATDRFTRFGDASDLAKLLRQGMPPGPLMGSDLEARALGTALKQAAKIMEQVSLALRMTRPLETMTVSQSLIGKLQTVGPLIEENARPFGILAEQISEAYNPLVLSEPLNKSSWAVNLQIQLDMIGQYLKKEQYVQAATLAREWVVSLLVYHFEGNSLIDYGVDRRPVENTLNNEVERQKPDPRPPLQPAMDAEFRRLPNHQEIGKVWSKLTQLRNDLAHVGMNLKPKLAEQLRKDIKKLYPQLEVLGEQLLGAGP